MLNAILDHVTTLDEFYSEIRKQHIEAHGEHYCAQHDAMVSLMAECDSYKELGTHQGASAAADTSEILPRSSMSNCVRLNSKSLIKKE